VIDQLYLVRHCEATGQAPDAPLTELGFAQAQALAAALPHRCVDRIICSPYTRAVQTIVPFAERYGLQIEIDDRLKERSLGVTGTTDWRAALESSFEDLDLVFSGGESSRAAMQRGATVITEIAASSKVMLVTHGNLATLILKTFDPTLGFADWSRLTNPDVYLVSFSAVGATVSRIDVTI
jgi:2,3-bisphosphoglycerate-dependent phosphoglycerate mutase